MEVFVDKGCGLHTMFVLLTWLITPSIGKDDQRHDGVDFDVDERMVSPCIIFADDKCRAVDAFGCE